MLCNGQAHPAGKSGLQSQANSEYACKWAAVQTVSWTGRKMKDAACQDPNLAGMYGPRQDKGTHQQHHGMWHVTHPMLNGK
jgi:hypothetical protein